jgi:hypothetical protein
MEIEENKKIELETQNKVNETEFDKLTMKMFIDNFIKTWYKSFDKLFSKDTYEELLEDSEKENFVDIAIEKILIMFNIFVELFWKNNNKFYIGVGFLILAYLTYFILVTK